VLKIEAIIQPFKLDDVMDALKDSGIEGVTVLTARGHGQQKGHTEVYRGREYNIDLLRKVKLEIVIPPERKDDVIRTLTEAARTGSIGDGKIFISSIKDAVRIRNMDRGDAAL